MNTVKALTRSARISPMKIRPVARSVQGLDVTKAVAALTFAPSKGAKLLLKTLKSAIANAENNANMSSANLVVLEAHIDDAKPLKRFNPVARGSAHPIHKRYSHIRIVLSEPVVGKAEKVKKTAKAGKNTTATKEAKE
jgi:large subunit ribosomal protein L22